MSQLSIESYIEARVRPLGDYFEQRAPKVATRTFMVDLVNMIMNTTSAVLGVLNLGTWAPVTVVMANTVMAIQDYYYIPSQLSAVNRALEDTHNLIIYWDSLSLVQRKTRKCKLRCTTTVEGAVLAIVSSMTGVDPRLPSEQGGGGEEEEK